MATSYYIISHHHLTDHLIYLSSSSSFRFSLNSSYDHKFHLLKQLGTSCPAGCCIASLRPLIVPPSCPLFALACCYIASPCPLVAPYSLSFWFSLNSSYDNEFYISKQLGTSCPAGCCRCTLPSLALPLTTAPFCSALILGHVRLLGFI